MEEKNNLQFYVGVPKTFTLPSGQEVTIREQNGTDDEVLSKISSQQSKDTILNINHFVAGIITDLNGKGKVTLDDVENLKLKDKHYIVLKSRMHSISEEMSYKHTCRNTQCKHEFQVDVNLADYDRDLHSQVQEDGKNKYAITAYPNGTDEYVELTLTSGVKLRYKYLTGKGEKLILDLAKDGQLNKNSEIYARGLEMWNMGSWVKLSSMNVFGPRDLIQIRASITKEDTQFMWAAEVTCPKCGTEDLMPFIAIEDFFYPTEI